MRMHVGKYGVFVANLQIGKNTEQIVTGKGRLVKIIAGKTSTVISYSLKVPPIML